MISRNTPAKALVNTLEMMHHKMYHLTVLDSVISSIQSKFTFISIRIGTHALILTSKLAIDWVPIRKLSPVKHIDYRITKMNQILHSFLSIILKTFFKKYNELNRTQNLLTCIKIKGVWKKKHFCRLPAL